MFKWIKRFFGLDYNDKDDHTVRFKATNPEAKLDGEALAMDMLTPKPIDRTVEEKPSSLDPFAMLNEATGKKKKPAAKKPAAKKAPKRMPNKLDKGK